MWWIDTPSFRTLIGNMVKKVCVLHSDYYANIIGLKPFKWLGKDDASNSDVKTVSHCLRQAWIEQQFKKSNNLTNHF